MRILETLYENRANDTNGKTAKGNATSDTEALDTDGLGDELDTELETVNRDPAATSR